MEIGIHRRFRNSMRELAEDERASIDRLVTLLYSDGVTPGMRLHKVGRFISLSPNMDLRIIALAEGDKIILLHVSHHDAAYQWAERTTVLDADQNAVEIVQLPSLTKTNQSSADLPLPVRDVLATESEDEFLDWISSVSPEWQEWLLHAYTNPQDAGRPPLQSSLVYSPTSDTALTEALALDVPDWRLYLHPVQKTAVDDTTSRSLAVTGGPGTGKTVVLLNRLVQRSPKRNSGRCSLLLTYSEGLVSDLYSMIRDVPRGQGYVLPTYSLVGNSPDKAAERVTARKYRVFTRDNQVFIELKESNVELRVTEVLIDEFQDSSSAVVEFLEGMRSQSDVRIVVAADLDQSIMWSSQKAVDDFIASCETEYRLNYSYRSSRQILQSAVNWLDTQGHTPKHRMTFGLYGPRVRICKCSDLAEQITESERVIAELRQRYSDDSFAVIYVQYYNPAYKGENTEVRELKRSRELAPYFRFGRIAKGKEYFAGVVFVSESFMARELTQAEMSLRTNTLYVALTRFRDEVTVVYTPACTVASALDDMQRKSGSDWN